MARIGSFGLIHSGGEWILQMKDQQLTDVAGKLCLFGGWSDEVSPGVRETPDKTLVRELEEELGLQEFSYQFVRETVVDIGGEPYHYHVYFVDAPVMPTTLTREGVAVRFLHCDLMKLLLGEGVPLFKGPRKGQIQKIFLPHIAEACATILSTYQYCHKMIEVKNAS